MFNLRNILQHKKNAKQAIFTLLEVFVREKLLLLLFFIRYFCVVSWFLLVLGFLMLQDFSEKKSENLS